MVAAAPSSWPAYLALAPGELRERAERAVASLAACRACPRDCGADRLAGASAVCRTGRHAVVASVFPHFGEEDCLRGWRGSGTVFFGHCNLRCAFCQNYDISQGLAGSTPGTPAADLAGLMLDLEAHGCHNLNLVTPEHVVPQVLEALAIAVERGLAIPVVYNTSAYDSLGSLALLDGVVDVYMPDFKLWSPERCARLLGAPDYAEAARAAIREMHRQVGPLALDADGLARRGVLLRHLVMPGMLDETREVLAWVASELGPDAYVNLMDQYHPAGRVGGGRLAEIDRTLGSAELLEALEIARDVGLRRLDERRPHPRLRRRML